MASVSVPKAVSAGAKAPANQWHSGQALGLTPPVGSASLREVCPSALGGGHLRPGHLVGTAATGDSMNFVRTAAFAVVAGATAHAQAFSMSELVADEIGGFVEDSAFILGTSQWTRSPFVVAAFGVACLREPRQLVAFFATTKDDRQEIIYARWLHSETNFDLVVATQERKVALVWSATSLIDAVADNNVVKLTFDYEGKTVTTRHKITDKKRVAFARVGTTCSGRR